MARRATIQLKVHGKAVQSIPLDQQDVECLIDGAAPGDALHAAHRPLVDLLKQIRDREATGGPG